MKTERRHELQQNVLADWLGKQVEQLKPYRGTIVGVALGVVVLFMAVSIWRSRSATTQTTGWASLFAAQRTGQLDDLRAVTDENPNDSFGLWAAVIEAERQLQRGAADLFRDRSAAKQRLEDARDRYRSVLTRAGSTRDELLLQRATFGLAQAYESLGELDEAIAQYETLAERWPDAALGHEAAARRETLGADKTKEFYAWFARQTPRVPSATPPGEGTDDTTPSADEPLLPDEPDLTVPSDDELFGDAPRADTTPDPDDADATDPPADMPPADGGATTQPPATDESAEETPAEPATEPAPPEETTEPPAAESGEAGEDAAAETPAETAPSPTEPSPTE